jgi:quercetin dioxygenase-like cupin family protein
MVTNAIDIVSAEDVQWTGLAHAGHREKVRSKQRFDIVHAETGFPVSCSFSLLKKGSVSPRHRHNYDAVTYIYDGYLHYGNKKLGAGMVIYTPENVEHGPKDRRDDMRHVTLQYPGTSPASRLMTSRHVDTERGLEELRALGVTIRDGVAHFPDGRQQDATEAVIEHLEGKKLIYGEPRYVDPVFINSENFPWRETNRPGLSFKHLAYFNECGPNISILRLEPGASTPGGRVGCIEMRVVLHGQVEYAGKRCPAVSRLYFPPHVPFDEMTSQSGAVLLVFQIAVPGGEVPPLLVVGCETSVARPI